VGWSARLRVSATAAVVAATFAPALAAHAAVGPPFSECPSVNYAPSCGIELQVNQNGTVSVSADTSVGPYDGGDDTLVGIVNNSTAPVTAVTVTGPGSDLSGFDYDGLCAYLRCSYGPTGYEGPGTSFVTKPNQPDSAEVDFTPALAPGARAYFSLEGALQSARLTAREGSLQEIKPILYVHGIAENSALNIDFKPLFDRLSAANPGMTISRFAYYQDISSCVGGTTPPVVPAANSSMPIDTASEGGSCDSEPDLGLNTLKLEEKIRALYDQTHQTVILVGYSMGATTIRGMLAYSEETGDGVAAMVDSVAMLHGVQQGSYLVRDAETGSRLPLVGTGVNLLSEWLAQVDLHRPAPQELQPRSAWFTYLANQAATLPRALPTVNTFGDEQIHSISCFLFWCQEHNVGNWGDAVLATGTDNPTQTPSDGGARFLPYGQDAQHWQYDEVDVILWDPSDDSAMLGAETQVAFAPEMHVNYLTQQDKITVTDCKTGAKESETDALFKFLNGRATSNPYECTTNGSPS
jgi:pimeloyl-ACP methyl ester carboxylesterase